MLRRVRMREDENQRIQNTHFTKSNKCRILMFCRAKKEHISVIIVLYQNRINGAYIPVRMYEVEMLPI